MDCVVPLISWRLVLPHDAHSRCCRSVGWLGWSLTTRHLIAVPLEGMPADSLDLPLLPALRWRSLSSMLALQTAFSGGHTIYFTLSLDTDGQRLLACLAPSLGTTLPGQTRRMLPSYVLATAVTRGFLLCGMALPCGSTWQAVHPIGGYACRMLPGLVALAFIWAAISFFGLSSEPFAAHTFTFATGSHASVAGWDPPTCVPCRQSLPPLAVPCLGMPPGVSLLLEDGRWCTQSALLLPYGPNPACGCTSATFGQPCAPRLWFCAATTRRQEAAPTRLPFSLADLITCLMRVLRLPPCTNQITSQGRGPKDLASTNSQGQGPKHPDVACSPSVFCGFGFL